MKKHFCLFLALLLTFSLLGCTPEQPEPEEPVTFYYPKAEIAKKDYWQDNGVIATQQQEAKGYRVNLYYLLGAYLKGPTEPGLTSYFPKNTRIVEIQRSLGNITVILDYPEEELTGLNKTISYACLAITCLGLTDAEQISIQSEESRQAGEKPVTMDLSSLVFLKNS